MSNWEKLMVYIDETDQWHGKPLHTALVEAAQKQGMMGATVTRGIEGFGVRQHHRIHTARIMELADLPIVVTIIAQTEAIAQFLPTLQTMVTAGLVTQESVNVVHHASVQQ